jgi:hypothetical protein
MPNDQLYNPAALDNGQRNIRAAIRRGIAPPAGGGAPGGLVVAAGDLTLSASSLMDGAIFELTDTQSRFGTKTDAKPLVLIDFAAFAAGEPLYHPTYSLTQSGGDTPLGVVSTDQVAPGKTHAWFAELKTMAAGSTAYAFNSPRFAERIYMFVRRYWTHDALTEGFEAQGTFNHKLNRTRSSPMGGNVYYQYNRFLYEAPPGHGNLQYAKYFSGTTKHSPNVRTWLTDESLYVASSDFNVQDSYIQAWRRGELITSALYGVSRNEIYPNPWGGINLDQVQNLQYVPTGFGVYYDTVVIDDTARRVLLCEHPAITTPGEREYQPAVEWSEGVIKGHFRKGVFSTLTGKYVCVVDAEGNQIGVGIPL